ncbi:MAG: hypothetical protein VYA25_11715 [Pseudomonadota bacterium]|nr:hypothetical protein [Pseudomonadota bacterium]MED5205817.1 hypothetical protein [Pseudomonadota bacterium]
MLIFSPDFRAEAGRNSASHSRESSEHRALAGRVRLGNPVCVRFAHFTRLTLAPSQVLAKFRRKAFFAAHLVVLAVHGASFRQFCGLAQAKVDLCAASAISARLHPSGFAQGGTVLL